MQWTMQLEARTEQGEVMTTELLTVSRPAMAGEGRAVHELAAYARSLGDSDFVPALILLEDAEVAAGARCRAPPPQIVLPCAPRRPSGSTPACGRLGSYAA